MFPRIVLLLFLFVTAGVEARSPHREPVVFSITNDVGFGNSVFVVGNHPDLGNNDVTKALKLRFTPGNVWTGQIAVQAGTQLSYKYIKRSTAQGSWCNAANSTDLTGTLSLNVTPQPDAPYNGKTIYYLSSWNSVDLIYNNGGGNFVGKAMTKVGPGRTQAESLFKASGIGEAGEKFEFVFSDGNGAFDNPPGGGNYLTALDVFQVQDGNVFTYQPPPVVSTAQIVVSFVNSSVNNIAGRNVRVYLPRGYTQNSARRYPVVYLHDGQNVFDPGGPFGSWSADATATREIGQGRMREAILVGVDNTGARIPEYQPPNDSYQGTQGRADKYADFLINNVRPFVDASYRTLNDRKNTATLGSSMGGLVSLYLGREFSTFGKIAVMSPALWISPNYIAQVNAGTKKPLRVHLDMGTAEGQGVFDDSLSMYDTHLAQGYAPNGDMEYVAGCGQAHNEPAWAARLPQVFQYLLPAREDPPELAQKEFPPRFTLVSLDPNNHIATFSHTALFGFTYTLRNSPDLGSFNTSSTTNLSENYPWTTRLLTDSYSDPKGFWKLQANPAP